MFYKMPFVLIFVIVGVIFLGPVMPDIFKQVLYSMSLSIKQIIVFLLPFLIFGLLFKAAVTLSKNATKIISIILILVCCSNFLSTFLSHYVGIWVYSFDSSIISPQDSIGLSGLWAISLPALIKNDHAMFSGIVLGLLASRFFPDVSARIALSIDKIITQILKGIIFFIPIFVAGFIVKLQYDGVVNIIIKDYTVIFACVACAQFSYIALVYFVLSHGKIKACLSSIKSMLPAALSGFSTMSSAASMPLTIMGAENNAQNKDLARSVIPATVNIHLVGDCFAIPIFAYAVLSTFGMPEPSFWSYLVFSIYFVLAKFSVAAIPGGGILVMLPILEAHLGFNGPMMSLITALYILFDPVITSANVLGNGAFAKMVDRLFCGKKLYPHPSDC